MTSRNTAKYKLQGDKWKAQFLNCVKLINKKNASKDFKKIVMIK